MFMIDFFKTMLLLPKPWLAWVGLLMAVNLMAPLAFLHTMEGKLVFAAGMAGAMVMMLIFKSKGFIRLLGVGHLFWVPLVIWLLGRMIEASGIFQFWILTVIILDTISLAIDISDIVRYFGGGKQVTLSLDS